MLNQMLFGEPIGQSWLQLSELALAFVLSTLIGLEREIRQKSAGLRTCTLVGVSSALIMLVSKYGFTDILEDKQGQGRRPRSLDILTVHSRRCNARYRPLQLITAPLRVSSSALR